MNGDKKVILHLVFDGMLFDQVYRNFEEMTRYENRYLLGTVGNNIQLKYIKNKEKLIIVDTLEEWGNVISNPEVDIIYLHGLWQSYFNAVDYIRQSVVVMWWCYGKELYENVLRYPPLLPHKLYKPKTHWFCFWHTLGIHNLTAELSSYSPKLYIFLIRCYYYCRGIRDDNKIIQLLSRIDYAFTPLAAELAEIKRAHSFIKAKLFVLRKPRVKSPIVVHDKTGYLLFEHSADITNNHLDIIAAIKKKKIDLSNRDIYIPLSYGDRRLAKRVKEKALFKGANVHCLMEPLPFNEYTEMISGCSHAIFGMLRQSGIGNICLCFQKGIKVFLFKDSIMFQQFKNDGYHIYSIEDDLNDESIKKPLTPEQAIHNYNKFYTKFDGSQGTYDQQFDKILNS